MNLEPVAKEKSTATVCNGRKTTENYMNLEFSESLCHYENAKSVLTKAAGLANNDTCDKCGHQKKRCAVDGDEDEKGDYMTMEPVNGRMTEMKRTPFPGYLPMCPATGNTNNNPSKQRNMFKNIMNKGLAEKSASIPSLNECNNPTSAADGIPVQKNANLICVDEPRKRSSSAGSFRYDEREPLCDDINLQSSKGASNHTSSVESMTSQIAKCPNSSVTTTTITTESVASAMSDGGTTVATVIYNSNSSSTTTTSSASATGKDDSQQTALQVHIRRSSSVPCKNNRDSSSSNDSGVSTGSLRYRGADFAEFELPLTTAMSTMRHRRTVMAATDSDITSTGCVHGSLPRRSKSTDRLKELSFRFQRFAGPMKSSSAGAEVPVCLKKDKGQRNTSVPIVCRSFLFRNSILCHCSLDHTVQHTRICLQSTLSYPILMLYYLY